MKALNIKENYILSKYWMNCLEDGNSIKAINNADNSIIGVSVNCLNSIWSNDHLFELKKKCKSIEMQQIFTIWAMLGQTSELQNKYENCKILELANMAVISAFQSNGLAGKLFQSSFEYGRENCYDVAKVDCTNAFSSKIARKFNMELVWEMSYDELFDIIGISKNKLPKPPHTYIQTYTLKLN